MNTWHAIVLGIVQGLGEFLPISSSGHLIVTPFLLGWPEHSQTFDVALHLGTLAAVLYAFRADWVRVITAGVQGLVAGKPFADSESRLIWLIALGSVPAAVTGLVLEKWAETTFRNPLLVAFTMAAMGAVLLFADMKAGDKERAITLKDALLIGTAQALALVPGVSRSGATISMALFLGYRREEAARFSFLLATPITLGAAILKLRHGLHGEDPTYVAIGIITSAVFGFLSIRVLLAYVKTRTYRPFVIYRFLFALLILVVWLVRR